jgi:hypothetical protein
MQTDLSNDLEPRLTWRTWLEHRRNKTGATEAWGRVQAGVGGRVRTSQQTSGGRLIRLFGPDTRDNVRGDALAFEAWRMSARAFKMSPLETNCSRDPSIHPGRRMVTHQGARHNDIGSALLSHPSALVPWCRVKVRSCLYSVAD